MSKRPRRDCALLGVHRGRAVYLLYNGVLGDKRAAGGNVLTGAVLAGLPPHPEGPGPRVIYGEACRSLARSKTKDTHTVEVVKAALVERLGVPAEEIRICTGTVDEIGDENLLADTCPVRYVLTVDKLREGWDCPLAYVLGSIGNAATPTAVEQLIGRVLRMPFANPTRVPALDRAYAFVLSDDVVRTAMQLRDRMVESCGFDNRSAEDALRVTATQTQRGLGFGRILLREPPPLAALPPALAAKARYDGTSGLLVLDEMLTRDEVKSLREAVVSEDDRRAIDDYWERERPVGTSGSISWT